MGMHIFRYDGPVYEFGRCLDWHWSAETMAVSERKAKNNLIFQFNKKHGRRPNSKIDLPGTLERFECSQ